MTILELETLWANYANTCTKCNCFVPLIWRSAYVLQSPFNPDVLRPLCLVCARIRLTRKSPEMTKLEAA